jgi:hypothetical protein
MWDLTKDPLAPWAAGCQMVALNFQQVRLSSAQKFQQLEFTKDAKFPIS